MSFTTCRLLHGRATSVISRDACNFHRIKGAAKTAVRSYTNGAGRRGPPLVIDTIDGFRKWRRTLGDSDHSLAFVPTMGALHDGHLSLAQQANEKCDNVAVSIFVNPAQFAPHEDLNAYPRTVQRDLEMLTQTKAVDVVFIPSVKELYPSGISLNVKEQKGTFVEVLGLGARMEGVIRPHFFRGVTTIITKLLNITQPSHLYLGQKDFQQASIIRHLIHDLLIPTHLVVGETVREPVDGLAMSSRNRYLSPPERAIAGVLYKALSAGKIACLANGPRCGRDIIIREAKQIIDEVVKKETEKGEVAISLEYLSLVDPWSLEELDEVATAGGQNDIFAAVDDSTQVQRGAVFSGAIRVGKTRLIDNVLIGCLL